MYKGEQNSFSLKKIFFDNYLGECVNKIWHYFFYRPDARDFVKINDGECFFFKLKLFNFTK